MCIAQILFSTGTLSFAGYVVPVATDAQQAGPHTDIVFPLLPTSVLGVVCTPGNGVTTASAAVSVSFLGAPASPLVNAPAADSGNPSSFSIRGLGPQTGTFGPKIVLKNGAGTVLSTLTPTPCAFGAVTVIPSFSCGLG